MRANRKDKHHAIACASLQLLGASVQEMTHEKDGCPDILVGYQGEDGTVELKTGKRKPNNRQIAWHITWSGRPVRVVSFPDDASKKEVFEICKQLLATWRSK